MKILVIDDEPMNVELLEEYLISDGFDVIKAGDGEDGISKLEENENISVILLDKMMPKLNGIEFLERVKIQPKYQDIPVIMQTAAADEDSIIEGVERGIYYYLTKPYKRDILLSVVHAAINDSKRLHEAVEEMHRNKNSLICMIRADFEYKTIQEAQNLAYFLANSFPEPEKAILGLTEIMINAIEHGNLGIGHKEKTALLSSGDLAKEISRRLKLPENINKKVRVSFERKIDEITIYITDEGKGFNWSEFLVLSPERATEPNGRGIVMAKMMSFDDLHYNEQGNQAVCKINIAQKKSNVA